LLTLENVFLEKLNKERYVKNVLWASLHLKNQPRIVRSV